MGDRMAKLEQIKIVIKKIANIPELQGHICFFGGSMPYIVSNQESNREHSDIDVLVDEEYMSIVRLLLKKYGIPIFKDSLDLNLDNDYGLKTYINDIYVEFEPMNIKNNAFTRKSFSPDRNMCGTETIPFMEFTDLIIPIEIDGIPTYSESLELIKVAKEKYKRDKDLMDVDFIDKIGINQDKYLRVKTLFNNSIEELHSYENTK